MKYFNQLIHSKSVETACYSPTAIWKLWEHRFRSRKQLHALLLNDPDRLHNDLGLSSEETLEEIRKPFWR